MLYHCKSCEAKIVYIKLGLREVHFCTPTLTTPHVNFSAIIRVKRRNNFINRKIPGAMM